MSIKVAINGFGRMGRLTLRAAWNSPELEFVQINENAADAQVLAHLLNFDSVHGRWHHQAEHNNSGISIENQQIICSQNQQISATDWSGCDLVIDATGVHKTAQTLQPYFEQGVKKVLVTAPVKDPAVANIVMGVNQQTYNAQRHNIVTAASCTTNCIAPEVKVLQEKLGIIHGSFTTIHNNRAFNGVNVDFATKTQRKWWSFGRKVRWLKHNKQWGSKSSMSSIVFNTLN